MSYLVSRREGMCCAAGQLKGIKLTLTCASDDDGYAEIHVFVNLLKENI